MPLASNVALPPVPVTKNPSVCQGYRGRRKNVYRIAKQAVMKAGQYASVTVVNANASSAPCGSPVSTPPRAELGLSLQRSSPDGVKKAAIEIDRRCWPDLAVFDKPAFAKIVQSKPRPASPLKQSALLKREAQASLLSRFYAAHKTWRAARHDHALKPVHRPMPPCHVWPASGAVNRLNRPHSPKDRNRPNSQRFLPRPGQPWPT